MSTELTDSSFWDQYWQSVKLPVEVKEENSTPFVREILKAFRTFLPQEKGLSVLEIGGALGGYLAYLAKALGYKVYALDNSRIGCQKLEENFQALNIPVTVYHRDILNDDISDLPQFDVVYSLGLIEHFSDPTPIVRKSVQLTRSQGTLLLSVPNYLGINHVLLRLLKPQYLSWHNVNVMNLKSWETFEKELGLGVIFKGYIGGWEPRIYAKSGKSIARRATNKMISLAARELDKLPVVRKLNSRWWSGYAMAVYYKP
jgi:2-polyprenyl-3-methyl-5-hydroxy-6-metoxy-1,4-benzoquinol methylase